MNNKLNKLLNLGRLEHQNETLFNKQSETELQIKNLSLFHQDQGDSCNQLYRYVRVGYELLPLLNLSREPVVGLKTAAKLVLSQGIRWQSLRLPFLAKKVGISNNLRIFGYDNNDQVTVKVAMPNHFRRGNLLREVRARKLVTEKMGKRTICPRLIAYERKDGRWLIEEMLEEEGQASLHDKALEFLKEYCQDFYRISEKSKPVNRCGYDKRLSILEESLAAKISGHKDFQPDKNWPVALCHNDLCPENMVKSRDGRLHVIDWEFAAYNPVAYDLAKLYTKHPALREDILAALEYFSRHNGPFLDANLQLAIALAWRFTDTKAKINAQVSRLDSDKKVNMEGIHSQLQQKLHEHQNLISNLL